MIVKNIVICCDGTRGKYEAGDKNTNVVRLFERLGKDGERQMSYYDPGIGTYSPLRSGLGRWAAKLIASASGLGKAGSGLNGNIEEAYRYLMDCYEPEDRVYFFGYSRGAHTVRVLAGMLHKCGLLTRGSGNLMPYVSRIYNDKNNDNIADGFKDSFSRECKPRFIGVWDTVASVGLIRRKQFSNNRLNGDVAYGYQALSIDERRRHFRVSQWDETNISEGQTIEQVWFSGCHADVGGQDADRGLSDIALEWMLRHAEDVGLILREDWRTSLCPDPLGDIKRSDRLFWRIGAKDRLVPEGSRFIRAYCSARTALRTFPCRMWKSNSFTRSSQPGVLPSIANEAPVFAARTKNDVRFSKERDLGTREHYRSRLESGATRNV